MAIARVEPFPRIVRQPGVQGGEPVVRGTRVPVRAIVVVWQAEGEVSAVRAAYPRLDEDDVEQALAYYAANRGDMDRIIRAQLADA